ncbi:hypothetical protein [Pedobacter nutrimenti]|uniref:hypothetical protein n=1 Tax=Pedobacter nutrimenti TaxID=1241337 RepID=UPI00292D0BDB|nr:hypothetical protein [Pedobacter nutrimenti]
MRKFNIISILLLCLLSIAITSCKKEGPVLRIISSLTIVNAVPDAIPYLVPDLRNGSKVDYYYASTPIFQYGISDPATKISTDKELLPLALYLFPDTLLTSKPLFDLKLQIPKGSINSLFLVGTVAQPDYKLVTAVPPAHNERDSTFGVRFANLSYQSKPVSVYVLDNGEQKVLEGLTYKGVSDYKKYVAFAKSDNLTFQFRDQETQNLLATYVVSGLGALANNQWRYKNFTLALKGLPGSADALQKQSTFVISDF